MSEEVVALVFLKLGAEEGDYQLLSMIIPLTTFDYFSRFSTVNFRPG